MLLNILLVAVILVAVAMVFVILLQRSEGGALGMSGGGPGAFMSARGTGDLLSRTTQILGAIFFVLCLVMTVLGGREHAKDSIVSRLKVGGVNPSAIPSSSRPVQQAPAAQPAPQTAPQAPSAPANPLDLFGQGGSSTPKGQ